MKKLFVIFSLVASALIFNSCSTSHYVTTQPVAPVYARPVSPGPRYVWVDGGWRWHKGRYVFVNGHWVKPRARQAWVGGKWVRGPQGFYWKRGYWR